jgi:ketosteroid isomerase-like protein
MSDAMSNLSSRVGMNRRLAIGRVIAAALLLALSGSFANAGQSKPRKHEARHEIDRLEEVWRGAVLNSDTTTLNGLLSDDYMAISSSGTLQTKDDAISNVRNRRVHFTSMNLSERKVRFYGNTALVTSLAQVQGTTPDGEVSGSFRYTHVYVRNPQGQWKIVSFEASRIRQPGQRKKQDPDSESK